MNQKQKHYVIGLKDVGVCLLLRRDAGIFSPIVRIRSFVIVQCIADIVYLVIVPALSLSSKRIYHFI